MPRVYSRCSKLVTRVFATTPCPLAIEFARMGRITEVKTNALDDATADGRDKLLATAMVQQFEKTFPGLLTAAGTEVQIIETDGFSLYLSPVIPVCFGVFVTARRPSVRFTRRLFVQRNPLEIVGSIVGQVVASVCCVNIINSYLAQRADPIRCKI